MRRLLVYGTLRTGERAFGALKGSDFVEEVRVPGYDMYALYGFPGILANKNNKEGIVGEVFEVSDNTLALLDHYEGFVKDKPERSHYIRTEIDVSGKPTDIYVYNVPLNDIAQVIPSGNWKERNNV